MSEDKARTVQFERTAGGEYKVRNVRGGTLSVGSGQDTDFTPVELLLAAIGTCTAIDVDTITSRRAEPTEFSVVVRGDKIRDPEEGNRLENLVVEFAIQFPEGEDGDKARAALPRSIQLSHDRFCTVTRTIEVGTPVTTRLVDRP
jgi:putative redox protein